LLLKIGYSKGAANMPTSESLLWVYQGELKEAQVVYPLPPGPEEESWPAHVRRISQVRCIAEVSEEQFMYWLGVLPPKWQEGSSFCFGEGEDAFRFFWRDRETGRYFGRQLTWPETVKFCRLADIPDPM
jgi:hypothetical protein